MDAWAFACYGPWKIPGCPSGFANRGPSDRTARYRLRTWFVLTPTVAGEVAAHWYLLIAAAMLAVLLAYASGWFLMRSAGLDATTALFASVPGGAAEMTVLGERHGARSDRVVLAQALRVFIVVAHRAVCVHRDRFARCRRLSARAVRRGRRRLLALLARRPLVGGVLAKLGMPNAWMLGPLGVTVALTFGEV